MSKTSLTRRAFIATGIAALLNGPAYSQSESTGFILVGASWCPVCHRAAPVLYGVAQQLQVPVLVASADNRPIRPFPNFVDASEHPVAREITKYPTTLLFASQTGGIVGMIEGYREPKFYMAQLISAFREIEMG